MDVIERLSKECKLSTNEINRILANAEQEYQCYQIKKKDKKKRQICAPSTNLKLLQRGICRLIFCKFKLSKFSTAYEKGNSILKNAKRHQKAKHVYKADIANFFPSITFQLFHELLKKKYKEKEIDALWKLCSYQGGLPIGSPASPVIANRIMLQVDKKLAKAARGCVYTRYADDMTFSSKKYIDKRIEKHVEETLRAFGFLLNAKKCKFYSLNTGIHITGLTLAQNGKITVGSKYKRRLKKLLHNYNTKRVGCKNKLAGKQAFVSQIER